MWLYSQSTGHLWDRRGIIVATGYSGGGKGKNEPKHEALAFVGPIPRGKYVIGEPYDSPQGVGPFALPLTPTEHIALGRVNFLFHGDSINDPGNASMGCIIQDRVTRQRIHDSNDKLLEVIE